MSKIHVDEISNRLNNGAPSFPRGISGTTASFSGNVSVGGTLTYEDVTNVDSVGLITARSGVRVSSGGIDVTSGGINVTAGVVTTGSISASDISVSSGINVTAGVVTAPNLIATESRIITIAEKLTRVDGNTVSLVYNSNSSNIGFCTNASGDITLNVTNIPTTSDFDNHVVTFNVFVEQTGTARTCTAITLNGVSRTINWAGGSLASAIAGVTTSSGTDIFTFTGINTVGSASTTANYKVLGMVNGGFR